VTSIAEVCAVTRLLEPVTHRWARFGQAGWVHWQTSGGHCYAWEQPTEFVSVDVHTGKAFGAQRAVDVTRESLSADDIVAKEF
jgi:hypothetical protein